MGACFCTPLWPEPWQRPTSPRTVFAFPSHNDWYANIGDEGGGALRPDLALRPSLISSATFRRREDLRFSSFVGRFLSP